MNAISLAVDQFVAVMTIHNPPANALSSRILEELSSCLDQCETDAGVRCIIIHGKEGSSPQALISKNLHH